MIEKNKRTTKTNILAITAVILSILSLFCFELAVKYTAEKIDCKIPALDSSSTSVAKTCPERSFFEGPQIGILFILFIALAYVCWYQFCNIVYSGSKDEKKESILSNTPSRVPDNNTLSISDRFCDTLHKNLVKFRFIKADPVDSNATNLKPVDLDSAKIKEKALKRTAVSYCIAAVIATIILCVCVGMGSDEITLCIVASGITGGLFFAYAFILA